MQQLCRILGRMALVSEWGDLDTAYDAENWGGGEQ